MQTQQHLIAEYVSPGHPDRLADAIVEGLVDAALTADPESLVGVEAAVHTDKVFVDGRVAAGRGSQGALTPDHVDAIVREAYRQAGYGGIWLPAPELLTVTQDLCLGPLSDEERDVRALSDDQNVVIGYACASPATHFLPTAHWLAWRIGTRLSEWRFALAANRFGPDFKVLPHLTAGTGPRGTSVFEWQRLTVSMQHAPGVGYEEQHGLLLPALRKILAEVEQSGVPGVAATFTPAILYLNGAGGFEQGGPHGDNGLSGKKLVVDHYGPAISIGGGALCGKDPHKVDRCGALRARQWARRLVEDGAAEARTTLCWSPGSGTPHHIEAWVCDAMGFWRTVPPARHPPIDWFSIGCITVDLNLGAVRWTEALRTGYFINPAQPWEAPTH
jgi:S-adenosylmethionine synthetase